MFDVAFSEILVIAVVALIVIGPEKLPKVARTLGHLTGKFQRYIGNVKSEIEREMQFEDLQKLQNELKERAESKAVEVQKHVQHEREEISDALSSAADISKMTHFHPTNQIAATHEPESLLSASSTSEHPQLSLQLASQETTGKHQQ